MKWSLSESRSRQTLPVVLAMSLFTGCGGNDPAANAQSQEPEVDPRFASADALIDHTQAVLSARPVDLREFFSLFYSETDNHRFFLTAMTELMITSEDFRLACVQQFGEGSWPTDSHKIWPHQTITLAENAGRRAKADCDDATGGNATLHLVKIGDRWWISVYSYEYSKPDQFAMSVEVGVLAEGYAVHMQQLIQRVRNAEFTSLPEAREAFVEHGARFYER